MSEPKTPLTQKPDPRLNWEMIEKNDNNRAVLIQTLSMGGTADDAVDFLGKIGLSVPTEKLKGRMATMGGKENYVAALKASPPPTDVSERHQSDIRTQLLLRDHIRGRVWCFVTETRAAAVYLFEKGENAGTIARVVSRMLKMEPEIEDVTVIHLMNRGGGGRDNFIARLKNGIPPYTEPLSRQELEQGEKDAKYYREIAASRLRERLEWMKTDTTRAFVLSLIANNNVSLYSIDWALRKMFRMRFAFKGTWLRIKEEQGDTMEEKRANFVKARRIGLDDPVLNQNMEALAAQAQNEYYEYLRMSFQKKSRLANIAKGRKLELDKRSKFEPLLKLADAIRSNSEKVAATDPPTSTMLRYTRTPGSPVPVSTLFIAINETDPEVSKLFHRYVRNELLEMQAGYAGILQDALTSSRRPEPVRRAILRGPRADDFEVFSFNGNGPGGR